MNTSYRANFPLLSKTMCIHLISDSNTKCIYLEGVHPMICDCETNIFSSLSFCSLILSHDLLNKTSISKFIDYVLMHVLILVYQVFLTSKTFNWYSTSIDIIWYKSHSNWYMQGNYNPPEVCMGYNSFNWYFWSILCFYRAISVHDMI